MSDYTRTMRVSRIEESGFVLVDGGYSNVLVTADNGEERVSFIAPPDEAPRVGTYVQVEVSWGN